MARNTLNLTRAQLAKMADNDAELTRQLEALVAFTNLTGFGQSQASDVVLDATGVTFAAQLPIGRYFIDLIVMAEVDTGSGTDGFSVINATTATLSAGAYALTLFDDAPTLLAADAVANDAASFLFSGAASTQLSLRGFVDVLQPGLVAFTVVLTGAPTSATLLAGSGLTTTIQREAA